ncbi:LacI family DNA-binding transcriptional regulator [Oceaniglobus trochenteri]|uniref:LacI family DNA-binding transcriptional regulator n=1 Tax=Oceaniglobus trochenteri TaxID=2763260 RepID=UPI001CFF7BE0|nr:LacI family DNA-binding transcriptional regulator [Oceaniglobus trochenteri]
MSRVTAEDVARRAGVSRSAVSRVFTPGASASRDTTERVRRAATELGYRHAGYRRRQPEQATIGLVVSNVENPFYAHATKCLSMALQARGFDTLLLVEMETVGTADAIVARCLDQGVAGLIVSSAATVSELARQCERFGIPAVFFNRLPNDAVSNCVTSNNFSGGRSVGEHLVATGHRRIAYLAGWEYASTQRDREAGLVAALREAGLEPFAREAGDFDYTLAQEATRRLFAGPALPDAVFVANDHMAFACMDVLRHELGLSVPGDVSVVGFDDVPLAAWPSYDLTTVTQPVAQMAEQAIEVLVAQIKAPDTAGRRIAIDGMLVLRGSTRDRTADN